MTSSTLRRTCDVCGGTRRKAFWVDETREAVIARCLDCGQNFNGPAVMLPIEWLGPAALAMPIDPGPEKAASS